MPWIREGSIQSYFVCLISNSMVGHFFCTGCLMMKMQCIWFCMIFDVEKGAILSSNNLYKNECIDQVYIKVINHRIGDNSGQNDYKSTLFVFKTICVRKSTVTWLFILLARMKKEKPCLQIEQKRKQNNNNNICIGWPPDPKLWPDLRLFVCFFLTWPFLKKFHISRTLLQNFWTFKALASFWECCKIVRVGSLVFVLFVCSILVDGKIIVHRKCMSRWEIPPTWPYFAMASYVNTTIYFSLVIILLW